HPLWQGEGAPGSGQQYEHIRHLLAQMPPEFVRLVADAAIDELAELQANEHAGHGAVSERQWTRVDLPYAGDPSLQ
ncbi:MAG TPA: hypothetical protein GYA07_14000, partial [Verrucomicrobia bacterium]|nr:hypothetical protein [Verrucomicrobiota bacterium]